jgi:hypothetical protein
LSSLLSTSISSRKCSERDYSICRVLGATLMSRSCSSILIIFSLVQEKSLVPHWIHSMVSRNTLVVSCGSLLGRGKMTFLHPCCRTRRKSYCILGRTFEPFCSIFLTVSPNNLTSSAGCLPERGNIYSYFAVKLGRTTTSVCPEMQQLGTRVP